MLTLYMRSTCSFCQRVIQMAENLNVTMDMKDIDEDETARKELQEKGGKVQVPFLVDEEKGVTMYDSSDIIDHLREHYAGSKNVAETSRPRVHVGGATCISCEG